MLPLHSKYIKKTNANNGRSSREDAVTAFYNCNVPAAREKKTTRESFTFFCAPNVSIDFFLRQFISNVFRRNWKIRENVSKCSRWNFFNFFTSHSVFYLIKCVFTLHTYQQFKLIYFSFSFELKWEDIQHMKIVVHSTHEIALSRRGELELESAIYG